MNLGRKHVKKVLSPYFCEKSILLLKIKFYKQTYCNAFQNMYNGVCVQKV